MQPTSNGFHKSNGSVSPVDEETMKKLGNQQNNHTNGKVPDTTIESPVTVVKKNFIQRLFKKDEKEKEKEVVQKKKPEGPKLKNFEIVRIHFDSQLFSHFLSSLV
jgi:hypothetical protein